LGFSESINNINFSTWNKSNGLPNNVITSLTMDKLGFYGLEHIMVYCRIDGVNSFEIYQSNSNEAQIDRGTDLLLKA